MMLNVNQPGFCIRSSVVVYRNILYAFNANFLAEGSWLIRVETSYRARYTRSERGEFSQTFIHLKKFTLSGLTKTTQKDKWSKMNGFIVKVSNSKQCLICSDVKFHSKTNHNQ